MIKTSTKFTLSAILILWTSISVAQSPLGPFMQGKNKKSFVLSYYSETYNRLYNTKDVSNTRAQTSVKSSSYNLFTTIGLSNKIDFQFNLSYASASGEITEEVIDNANGINSREGLQDFSFFTKYLFKEIKAKNSSLSLIGATGISFPVGNYKVENELESVVSIGSRSNQFTNLFVANYKLSSGLFLIGTGGYSIRGNAVPNALISEAKLGFAGSFIYFDVFYANQHSPTKDSFDTTTGQPIFQVSNVNFSRIGLNVYIPIIKKVGLAGGANRYTSGLSKNEIGGYGALIFNL
jgi:hypothetical protein